MTGGTALIRPWQDRAAGRGFLRYSYALARPGYPTTLVVPCLPQSNRHRFLVLTRPMLASPRGRTAQYRHVRAFDVEDARLTGVQRPRMFGVVRLNFLSLVKYQKIAVTKGVPRDNH
jgi:hypothetical protein